MNHSITMLTITMAFGQASETIHPVLLQDEQHNVLVDCSFVGSLPLIEAELAQRNVLAADITHIVLTHQDHDHMGAAAAFKAKYPAVQICASALEEPYISGREKPLRLVQAEQMQKVLPPEQQDFGKAFCALLKRVQPVAVDVLLHDGDELDWCGGCRVIATPGHTPGHITLYLQEQKIVIAGDAIALKDGKPAIANPQFTLDAAAAADSMEKLLHMGAEAVLCYHGGKLVV